MKTNIKTYPVIMYPKNMLHQVDINIKLNDCGYNIIKIHDIYTIWERKAHNKTNLVMIVGEYKLHKNA